MCRLFVQQRAPCARPPRPRRAAVVAAATAAVAAVNKALVSFTIAREVNHWKTGQRRGIQFTVTKTSTPVKFHPIH